MTRKPPPPGSVLSTELAAAIRKDPAAQKAFNSMPPSHRAEYSRFVGEAKKPETRLKRAAKSVEMIRAWAAKHT